MISLRPIVALLRPAGATVAVLGTFLILLGDSDKLDCQRNQELVQANLSDHQADPEVQLGLNRTHLTWV